MYYVYEWREGMWCEEYCTMSKMEAYAYFEKAARELNEYMPDRPATLRIEVDGEVITQG